MLLMQVVLHQFKHAVNDSLLAMYGAFDREDASRENVLTMTLFPLSLAVGAILVFACDRLCGGKHVFCPPPA